MHCATWCPCIVQLYVHALCNFMSMHCATLSIYGKLGQTIRALNLVVHTLCNLTVNPMSMYVCIVQLYVHALCNLMSMHCATWCPCIVQLDVHALYKVMIVLCNLMSMHCATWWCPCIVQGYALCNLMSMHCATWCPCIVQLHQYMEN